MGDSNAYGDYFRFSSNNDICPKGFSVPTRKELAAETTLAEKNPINNKTIKDSNGTALALSSFLKLPAAGRKNLDLLIVFLWTAERGFLFICRRGANLRGA
jgi:hypothetical protein